MELLSYKEWSALTRLGEYNYALEEFDRDLMEKEVSKSPKETLELLFKLNCMNLIEISHWVHDSDAYFSQEEEKEYFDKGVISVKAPNDIIKGFESDYKELFTKRSDYSIHYSVRYPLMGIWIRITALGKMEVDKDDYERYYKVFEPTFYSEQGWQEYNVEHLHQRLKMAKDIQKYFNLGKKTQLPPLEINNSQIEKIHATLCFLEDEKAIGSSEEYEVLMTMLTALTLWGNDDTNKVLEEKLINNTFLYASDSDEIEEKEQMILYYYILAIASNSKMSKNMETFFLNLIDTNVSLGKKTSNTLLEIVCYLATRHHNKAIMAKLLELLKSNQNRIEKKVLISIFKVFAIYGEIEELLYIFGLGKSLDKCWGTAYFIAQTKPHRAELIYTVCEKFKDTEICEGTSASIKGVVVCNKIKRIEESYKFKLLLESKKGNEVQSYLNAVDKKGHAMKLWELLYPQNSNNGLPKSNEIKLFRAIKALDDKLFEYALFSVNALAVSVILIDGIDEWIGLDVIDEQREFLFNNKKKDIDLVYEPDFWASPVQNSSLELMDEVSRYLIHKQFPTKFFKYLRLMLTMRKHMPNIDPLSFNLSDKDGYYCHPKDIFPIIVETLRRELLYKLCIE